MGIQMTFEDIEIEKKILETARQGDFLDALLKDIARSLDRNTLARDIGKSYSYLSEILNSNGDNKKFQLYMIPALADSPKFHELIDFLCDIAKPQRVHPQIKPTMTPEEELKTLKKIIFDCKLTPIFKENGLSFD